MPETAAQASEAARCYISQIWPASGNGCTLSTLCTCISKNMTRVSVVSNVASHKLADTHDFYGSVQQLTMMFTMSQFGTDEFATSLSCRSSYSMPSEAKLLPIPKTERLCYVSYPSRAPNMCEEPAPVTRCCVTWYTHAWLKLSDSGIGFLNSQRDSTFQNNFVLV